MLNMLMSNMLTCWCPICWCPICQCQIYADVKYAQVCWFSWLQHVTRVPWEPHVSYLLPLSSQRWYSNLSISGPTISFCISISRPTSTQVDQPSNPPTWSRIFLHCSNQRHSVIYWTRTSTFKSWDSYSSTLHLLQWYSNLRISGPTNTNTNINTNTNTDTN